MRLAPLLFLVVACAPPDEPLAVAELAIEDSCLAEPEVAEYFQYIVDHACPSDDAAGCLEPTSYLATRSDGRQVVVDGVYRWKKKHDTWRGHGESATRAQLLPHFLGEYLKKLRDAYAVCPGLHQQAYDQIDYLVSEGKIRGNGALVWENRLGYAQSMEQAETALRLAAFARIHEWHGHTSEARGTLRYALRAARPFFTPIGVGNGGVRSRNQDACAAKTARLRPCFWFHSRGRSVDTRAIDEPDVPTVLNQHLHAVRDLLELSVLLRRIGEEMPHIFPGDFVPPGGFGSGWADAFEDRAIGGLYQLAFSNGHKAVAPDRPPNLAQFLQRHGGSSPFYSLYYNFDLVSGERLLDSKHAGTCHYQGHSMNLLAAIWANAHKAWDAGRLSAASGWRVLEALDRLAEGLGEPVGAADSTHAVWQIYNGEQSYYRNQRWGCPETVDGYPERLRPENHEILTEALVLNAD